LKSALKRFIISKDIWRIMKILKSFNTAHAAVQWMNANHIEDTYIDTTPVLKSVGYRGSNLSNGNYHVVLNETTKDPNSEKTFKASNNEALKSTSTEMLKSIVQEEVNKAVLKSIVEKVVMDVFKGPMRELLGRIQAGDTEAIEAARAFAISPQQVKEDRSARANTLVEEPTSRLGPSQETEALNRLAEHLGHSNPLAFAQQISDEVNDTQQGAYDNRADRLAALSAKLKEAIDEHDTKQIKMPVEPTQENDPDSQPEPNTPPEKLASIIEREVRKAIQKLK
jgi:hypothetical protein